MKKKKLQKKYDKLKENHDYIRDDLYIMLEGKQDEKFIVKLKYKMLMATELFIMAGEGTKDKPSGIR